MRSSIDGVVPEPGRVAELGDRERARFWRERPRSVELRCRGLESMPNGVPMSWVVSVYQQDPLYISYGEGAHIVDVDGHRYLDANVADTSTFCGYSPLAVTEAIAARASSGAQFMLPIEDSLWVAEEMGRRFGLPRWQFTLSATTANIEAIRLTRSEKSRRQPKRGPTRHPDRPVRPVLSPIHVPNTRPERHPNPFSDGFLTEF